MAAPKKTENNQIPITLDSLPLGAEVRAGDCNHLIGDELTFAQLVREPSSSKLFVWMAAAVGEELTDDSEFLVAQIERVTDFDPETDTDPGDEEFATVMLDIPGFSSKPVLVEYDDMEPPEIEEGDDPNALHNRYIRIWCARKSLPALEQLAIGAAAYGKCKSNQIDTTEDLLEAFRTGSIKKVLKSDMQRSVRQVLTTAGIQVPKEQSAQSEQEKTHVAEIVTAQPDDISNVDAAKALHKRILDDAQTAAESIWDLCKSIKEMRDGKHYRFLLYGTFEGYCEEELGMSRAQAYRYIQIAEGMTAENVSSMRQIGTTKLALLASVTEEQREIITAAVDVESTTVRALKAKIEALKHQNDQTEAALQDAERRVQRWCDDAEEKRQQIDKLHGKVLVSEQQIRKMDAELKNNYDYIGRLQARNESKDADIGQLQDRITELESRPVEVAVQTDTEALDQLRREYESKLRAQEAEKQKLEDELNQRDDNDHFIRLDINYREARAKVQTLCTMVANLSDCKEKDTLKKNIRNIILDIEQRIGKE